MRRSTAIRSTCAMPPSTPAPCRNWSPRRSARSRTCWWCTTRRSSCSPARSSRPKSEGIKVLQINLQSNQPSAAFVGANWERIGREIAEDIVKECGAGSGKSGKVAIIPGQLTAADSVIMNDAAFKVFEQHKEIEVVSNQASDWEPEKARQITATVLQQHAGPVRHLRPLGRAHDGRRQCGQGRRQGRRRAGLFDRRRRRRGLQGGRGRRPGPHLELRRRRPGP